MLKKYALLLMLVNCYAAARAQVFFDKSYTTIQDITTARETNDGGFIVSGTSLTSGDYNMTMMKTDASGNLQWIKAYGNATDNEFAGAVIQTLDGGYLLAGRYQGAFLVKTDPAGVTQWNYKYSLGTQNGFQDIYEMPDSSYILTFSSSGNGNEPGFCRIDKNGTLVWIRSLYTVSTNGSELHNIIPLSNGEFMAVGLVRTNSSSGVYESVVRFDAAGTIIWFMRFGFADRFYSGCQTSDSNVVIVGGDGCAMKIDLDGNLLWRQQYTFSTYNFAIHSVVENPSGELLLFLKVGGGPPYPATILRTDGSGNPIAAHDLVNINYPSTYTHTTNSILAPTSDGGYVLGTQNSLKKITTDLSSTCGIATLILTAAPEAIAINNQTYTNSGGGSGFTTAFSEMTLTSVETFNCSIILLSASTSSTDPVCNGQCTGTATVTAAGGQGPYTYLWSPGGQTTAAVSGLCAGTYTVAVTDANSTVVSSTVTISQPSAIVANASAVIPTFCIGGCTDLNISVTGGTPGYTYLWMPGNMTGATPNVCPGATTSYSCTITDANSCMQTASMLVTVNPLPAVTAIAADSICTGSTTMLSAGGANAYVWNPGNLTGGSVTVAPPTTTTYTVTGTDSAGCTNSATTIITVNPLPTVSYLETQTMLCINWNAITLSAGSPVGGIYSGNAVTGNSFDPAVAGNGTHDIFYTYTDTNGCTASDTSQVTVDLCTAVAAASTSPAFSAYPNPFSNSLVIEGLLPGVEVCLVNILGETVILYRATTHQCTLPTDGLPPGTYFIRVSSGNGHTVRKVIKI
jgi:hypothetical protein